MTDENSSDVAPLRVGDETQIKVSVTDYGPRVVSCRCTGPREGEPVCPCRMKLHGVVRRDGRWIVPEQDLGAADVEN